MSSISSWKHFSIFLGMSAYIYIYLYLYVHDLYSIAIFIFNIITSSINTSLFMLNAMKTSPGAARTLGITEHEFLGISGIWGCYGLLKMGDPQVTISITKLILHDLHLDMGYSPIETFSLDELSSCPMLSNSHKKGLVVGHFAWQRQQIYDGP